jgi:hypothetical protein
MEVQRTCLGSRSLASLQRERLLHEYAARLRATPATTGNGTHCNLATDDDPTNPSYIWAQDEDSDPSTPLACSGDDNQIVRLCWRNQNVSLSIPRLKGTYAPPTSPPPPQV